MATNPRKVHWRVTLLQRVARRIMLSATAALLLACGGGEPEPGAAPLPVPAQSGAATIGAAGGDVEAVLAGGTRVRLEVPPQALAQDVDFRLDPEPAPAGTQGRLRIRPAGVVLRRPVTLIVTLPASAGTPDPDLSLAIVAGAGRIPVGGRPDPATRTLRAVLHHLGVSSVGGGPLAADRQRALSQPRARADDEEDPAVIAELVRVNYQQQLDALTQVVTVLTQQQGTLDNAIAAQAAFESVLHFAGSDSDARVRTLAQSWREFVCSQRSFAVSEFERYDGVAVNVIDRLVGNVLIWGQLATQMRAVLAQLVPPLAGCADAPDDPAEPVQARMPTVLDNLRRALGLLGADDFEQMLDDRLPELYRLERVLQLYGVNASALPLIGEQAARLRQWAWSSCARGGASGSQRRQARLLALEAGGNPLLAEASPYDEAALRRDIQLCGIFIEYQLRDADGIVKDSGYLEDFAGDDRTEREIELAGIEVLRFEGVRTQTLRCPSGAPNDERLVIAAGRASGPLTTVRTLTPVGIDYLPFVNGLPQGLDIPVAELMPLLRSGDSLAGAQIVVRREGGLCNGEFVNLESHDRLLRLVVKEPRTPTGWRGTVRIVESERETDVVPEYWAGTYLYSSRSSRVMTGTATLEVDIERLPLGRSEALTILSSQASGRLQSEVVSTYRSPTDVAVVCPYRSVETNSLNVGWSGVPKLSPETETSPPVELRVDADGAYTLMAPEHVVFRWDEPVVFASLHFDYTNLGGPDDCQPSFSSSGENFEFGLRYFSRGRLPVDDSGWRATLRGNVEGNRIVGERTFTRRRSYTEEGSAGFRMEITFEVTVTVSWDLQAR